MPDRFQKIIIILLSLSLPISNSAQSSVDLIEQLEHQLAETETLRGMLFHSINHEKWVQYKSQFKSYGLPSDDYIEHLALFLEYAEEHEQSRWVAHMLTPEVEDEGATRTNDFRIDSLVSTGTAAQTDYFNYYPDRREEDQYEGFGYDRGHLAPSADFRWYKKAVSESYYYSNISPQHPDLNRDKWSDLESFLRGYVIRNNTALAIITGPVLIDELTKIPESPNGVSIPKLFYKVAYDHKNKRTIGFLMGNNKLNKPLDSYAISIDDLELLTGLDFFSEIDPALEAGYDVTLWFSEYDEGTVLPIKQHKLPRGHYNTVTVTNQINTYKEVTVCGQVVSTRHSRKGHAWINLDRKYPNDYFSAMIYKDQLTNFTYDPVGYLRDKKVCIKGEVGKFGNKPVMKVSREFNIKMK